MGENLSVLGRGVGLLQVGLILLTMRSSKILYVWVRWEMDNSSWELMDLVLVSAAL